MRYIPFLSSSLFLLFVAFSCQQKTTPISTETEAIKLLLEKEAATWRSGNFKEHAACWQIQPYSKMLVSLADGTAFDVPAKAMIDPKTKLGNGGKAIQSNFKFKINATDAWVSHDEIAIAVDGTKTYSYEIRMVEKIDGNWKIVGQSIHIYTPTK